MSLLGSSPVTSSIGYVVIIVTVVQTVITEDGIPHDLVGWLNFGGKIAVGIALRFAKDSNVSNAPVPTADAKPVS